mgnify:CR=1 FL=1|jgi:hypothetical protein
MSPAKKKNSYIISVSVATGCYRHIKIDSTATLLQLHKAIIDAFEFYDDHLHVFFMDNSAWSDAESYYSDMMEGEDRYTANYTLEKVGLFVGRKFKYIFDFGDEWRFQCKVMKVLDEATESPEIVRSAGEAPSQYWDEDEELDEDE